MRGAASAVVWKFGAGMKRSRVGRMEESRENEKRRRWSSTAWHHRLQLILRRVRDDREPEKEKVA
jgi:hypothetical protein